MKNIDVLVIGYFGFKNNQIDGQTIKTRNIYDLIVQESPELNIEFYDTQEFQSSKFSIFTAIGKLLLTRKVVYLPGQNNLKHFYPIIDVIQKIKKFGIVYIAVGGWLNDFLLKNPSMVKSFKKFDGILVESDALKNLLISNFNLIQADVLTNFRIQAFQPSSNNDDDFFRVVFMARVTKLKGIDLVIDYAIHTKANQQNLRKKVLIDFYGPINHKDSLDFLLDVEKYDNVRYLGVVEPEVVFETLQNYDVLVLPTTYPGEGFPGTIVDAYISGIPVVVSRWKYLPEFVEDKKTGFLFDVDDKNAFFAHLDKLCNDPELLSEFKINAKLKSDEYSHHSAWPILEAILNK
ncbi:hypothetical protein N180_15335 [Pedobacter antarcticus 4BY]|uniref:Glycosyl transferase family 1 domain-containing protein n=2 Tax=Pedobacter antarcticus TaxID=34086 RepID=A0A081PDZ7_9SPHI|nr:glycosyltransferase family 4 protein [Pedobacter antarcticus]KEQ28920.1 hypothetical protein N180_15335 [Pedobacter antarcticus 4BY]SFF13014.1 Glycosyltransferase involved in cell wall bisynthesis [Pedobacter antarcticus]